MLWWVEYVFYFFVFGVRFQFVCGVLVLGHFDEVCICIYLVLLDDELFLL